jgi:WD40 repeat protein
MQSIILSPGGWAARIVGVLALSAVVLLSGGLARSDTDGKTIAKLIEQLGDDEQDVRKAAEKKLREIGEEALEQLKKAAKGHADADVRLRAIVLARAIEKGLYGEIRKFTGHTAAVRHIAVSKDGKRMLSGSQDKTMRLWDLQTGKEIRQFKGHTGWVWSCAWSPDNKTAVSAGSLDKTLRLWDVDTGNEIRKFEGHTGRAYGAAFSPDGKHILSGGAESDPTLRLWETDTGKEVRKYEGHTGWIWKVLFSPDGKKALSAGCNDYSARIWDVDSGKQLVTISQAHGENFRVGIAWHPDGKKVLTSGRDGFIRLWDAETGKELHKYTGLADNVECLAYNKDGKRFLAGENKMCYLFDSDSGKIIHRFEDHTDWVYAIAFTPDGRRAVSGGADNTVRLWGLPK